MLALLDSLRDVAAAAILMAFSPEVMDQNIHARRIECPGE
jgi:hypothetical protein